MTTTDLNQLAQKLVALSPELANEIAYCCEQAYRRGYQQGALYGFGLSDEIENWRFSRNGLKMPYRKSLAPPDNRWRNKFSTTPLYRLQLEAGNASDLVRAIADAGQTSAQASDHSRLGHRIGCPVAGPHEVPASPLPGATDD